MLVRIVKGAAVALAWAALPVSTQAQTSETEDLLAAVLAESLVASLNAACGSNSPQDAMLSLISSTTEPYEVPVVLAAIRQIGAEAGLCAQAMSALSTAGQAANEVVTAGQQLAPGTVDGGTTGEDAFPNTIAPLENITPPGGAGGAGYQGP